MKYHPFILWICLSVLSIRCSKPEKTFGDYNVDPLKTALTKNHVFAYVSLINNQGKIEKWDSTTLDFRGNAIGKIGFAHGTSDAVMKYDSVGRLIRIDYPDSGVKETFTYDSIPEKKIFVMNVMTRRGNISDSVKINFEYDKSLTSILSESVVDPTDNKKLSERLFTYEKGRIQKILEKDLEGFEITTTYFYQDSILIRSEITDGAKYHLVDYYSPNTGLRDSTRQIGTLYNRIYKYYFRDQSIAHY